MTTVFSLIADNFHLDVAALLPAPDICLHCRAAAGERSSSVPTLIQHVYVVNASSVDN